MIAEFCCCFFSLPSNTKISIKSPHLYPDQVKLSTGKLDDVKKEYEMKLDEYARLLDIRAARIKV